jgi:hypothetical protein
MAADATMLVSPSVYTQYLTAPGGGGWNSVLGPFGAALQGLGTFSEVVGAWLFLLGITSVTLGLRETS